MDVAVESWHLPTPRDWRLIGVALLLAAAVVVVVQRNGPAPVPADPFSDAVPRSIVPPIRGIDADPFGDPLRASLLGSDPGGSISVHGVRLPARIAYMNGGGYGDIHEMNEDGSGRSGRVTDPGHDCGPAYSPDGRYMMFSSQRSSGSASGSSAAVGPAPLPWYPLNFDLYLLDLETGTVRQVTTNPGIDLTAAWSPDGRRIAFSRGELGQLPSIWVMNADGTGLRQLTQQVGSTFHWIPDWSPDGNRIVYMSFDLADLAHPSVGMVDADGTDDRVLVDDGGFPAWSPDGRSIAFASSRGQPPGEYDVYVMDADGSHQRRLQHQEGAEFSPHWSPDGRSIVYVQDPDGWVFEVTMLLPDGDSLDVEISSPALSSIRARTHDVEFGGPALSSIWRMRADGSDPVQLTEPNGDLFPIYAPAPKG